MKKSDQVELRQLKVGLETMMVHLNDGLDHLDDLTCATIGRALGELLQETANLPPGASEEEIADLATAVLVGTIEVQQELEAKWAEELQPVMERARERAESLQHELADFTCLAMDGQKWGAICVKCLEWVYVRPDGVGGALIHPCRGWLVSWRS